MEDWIKDELAQLIARLTLPETDIPQQQNGIISRDEHRLLDYLKQQNNNMNGEYEDEPDSNQHRTATAGILLYLPNVQITRVRVVHNNFLRGMYELKKMEYKSRYGRVQEITLIHSTSACKVPSIIKDNLDWRRVSRNKYGSGVSFSGDADYANFHSNSLNGSKRAFIVASVLVSSKTPGSSMMTIPPSNIDTSYSTNGKVYVKYCDNEFLIKYVVYYDAPERTSSKHFHHGRRRFYL